MIAVDMEFPPYRHIPTLIQLSVEFSSVCLGSSCVFSKMIFHLENLIHSLVTFKHHHLSSDNAIFLEVN